jgi:hypothetical protein
MKAYQYFFLMLILLVTTTAKCQTIGIVEVGAQNLLSSNRHSICYQPDQVSGLRAYPSCNEDWKYFRQNPSPFFNIGVGHILGQRKLHHLIRFDFAVLFSNVSTSNIPSDTMRYYAIPNRERRIVGLPIFSYNLRYRILENLIPTVGIGFTPVLSNLQERAEYIDYSESKSVLFEFKPTFALSGGLSLLINKNEFNLSVRMYTIQPSDFYLFKFSNSLCLTAGFYRHF